MDYKHLTIQPKCYKSPPFSIEVSYSPSINGETVPRRHPSAVNGLKYQPEPRIATVFDVFVRSAKKFGDLNAVGTRKLIKTHNKIKKSSRIIAGKEEVSDKTWQYFELGTYEYLTFGEYKNVALDLGCGFRKLGLEKGDKVHLFAATSANWLLFAHAAISQSLPIVTSYATLGSEGLIHSLIQTHAKLIFVDPGMLTSLIDPLKISQDIQFVIWNSDLSVNTSDINSLQNAHPHLAITSLDELRKLGEENSVEVAKPAATDLCCIMYTSGSTGPPKGVPLTHRNIVAAITGIHSTVGQYVSPSDSVLTYLPLAHSFEFAFENACFFWGVTMGYGSPRTLSNASMRNCKGDIAEFRPSILIGVPAVWETIRKGVELRVEKEGFVRRSIFWGGLALKWWLLTWRLPGASIIDSFALDAVRKETGGRLRACFNGAGPIGRDTRRFVSAVIAPLISGYGMTETTAMGTLQDPLEWTDDTLGSPPTCIEIKLVSRPELGYLNSNSPPQGEILIRGPAVMSGYYLNAEEAKGVFDEQGWLRTGDIGEWAPNGHLRVIDRIKNLVKGSGGEYIALEKLESVYRQSPLVGNICVFASGDRARPVAIIFPDRAALLKLTPGSSISDEELVDLVKNAKIQGLVLKNLQNTGREAGLASFEIIDGIVLTCHEWTVQNGLLTPSQKLNRRSLVKHYQDDLERFCGGSKSLL